MAQKNYSHDEKTTIDELVEMLPENIKESTMLWYESKKVLAALLELMLNSKARQTRVIFINNEKLRALSSVGTDKLSAARNQLVKYNLIEYKQGVSRGIQGAGHGIASEYRINFKKLTEPIKEKTFEELFDEFLEDDKSSETSISSTTTTTSSNLTTSSNTTIDTTTTTNPNTTIDTTITTNSNITLDTKPISSSSSNTSETLDIDKLIKKHQLDNAEKNQQYLQLMKDVVPTFSDYGNATDKEELFQISKISTRVILGYRVQHLPDESVANCAHRVFDEVYSYYQNKLLEKSTRLELL